MIDKKRSAARDGINTQEVTANLAELIDMSRSGLGAGEPEQSSELQGALEAAGTLTAKQNEEIEEAIMNDSVAQFKKVNLTPKQIIDFGYEVTGPKSSNQTERDSRIENMDQDTDTNFHLNYNVVMLACQYGSKNILEWLFQNIVLKSKNPEQTRQDLVCSKKHAASNIQAVHLACMFGNLEVLRILYFKFQADFGQRTAKGFVALHVAAQFRDGIVALYFLKDIDKYFNANVEDYNGATPLHYAVMALEESNIQALLSLGADINFQDNLGDSLLHVAVSRFLDDQQNFGIFKEIIKEML